MLNFISKLANQCADMSLDRTYEGNNIFRTTLQTAEFGTIQVGFYGWFGASVIKDVPRDFYPFVMNQVHDSTKDIVVRLDVSDIRPNGVSGTVVFFIREADATNVLPVIADDSLPQLYLWRDNFRYVQTNIAAIAPELTIDENSVERIVNGSKVFEVILRTKVGNQIRVIDAQFTRDGDKLAWHNFFVHDASNTETIDVRAAAIRAKYIGNPDRSGASFKTFLLELIEHDKRLQRRRT